MESHGFSIWAEVTAPGKYPSPSCPTCLETIALTYALWPEGLELIHSRDTQASSASILAPNLLSDGLDSSNMHNLVPVTKYDFN
jgi:hypothetical protein